MQHCGFEYHAIDVSYEKSASLVRFSLDIANAYPKETDLLKWQRTFELKRPQDAQIIITEDFELKSATDQIILNYMTLMDFVCTIPGEITFTLDDKSKILFSYDSSIFAASKELIPLEDERISKAWGADALYRLKLKTRNPLQKATLTLSIKRLSSY